MNSNEKQTYMEPECKVILVEMQQLIASSVEGYSDGDTSDWYRI